MARPQTITVASLAASTPTNGIKTSYRGKNATFNIGVQAEWTTDSIAAIEITMSDPANFTSDTAWNAGAIWTGITDNPLASLVSESSIAGTITANCFGVRFANAAGAITALTLTVLQD